MPLRKKPPAKYDTALPFDAEPEPIQASLGDKVTIGDKDTVYTVNKVYVDGTEVNLILAGTNLERYRVKVRELKFVERSQPSSPAAPTIPEKPRIDVDAIHERLVVAYHDSVQDLSAAIVQLKQQLSIDGAPASIAGDLDKLCAELEASWDKAISSSMERFER